MMTIRDQRGAVYLPANPEAEDGHGLVAEKAHDRGARDRGGMRQRLRL
jgi:hypothetical protein